MSDYDYEVRQYTREVEAEAARLVRQGLAPYEAMETAGRIVRDRRKRKADDNNIQKWRR